MKNLTTQGYFLKNRISHFIKTTTLHGVPEVLPFSHSWKPF